MTVELTILIVCAFSLLIQLFYFLFFFRKIIFFKDINNNFNPSVSIIICAKDEYKNLENYLKTILNQDYPNFEVIVVNDQSVDSSRYLLENFEKRYNNLVVVNIDDNVKHSIGKKFALTMGIKTAKHEFLLLSDADCFVESKHWISSMVHNFKSSDIILGYGNYEKKPGLLNMMIRFDSYIVALQYLSFSLKSLTYMGVGRNLAYRKSLFFKNKGFANHLHIPSGDDDLFIKEVAEDSNVIIEMSKNSHTISKAKDSWSSWIRQKKRHFSTSTLYNLNVKFFLGLFPLSQLLFFGSLCLLIILKVSFVIWLPILVVKLLLSYLMSYFTMKRLNCIDLLFFQPFLEIFHLIFHGLLFIFSVNQTPKKWSS